MCFVWYHQIFRNEINLLNKDFIKEVRGKGLMNAIEFENKEITDKVCIDLLDKGLLTKSTHDNILRMSPPLIIKEEELLDALELIKSSLNKV